MKFEVSLTSPSGKKPASWISSAKPTAGSISLDGQPVEADAVEIAPNIFSILLRGESHEIRIARQADGKLNMQTGLREFTAEVTDPRAWRGRRLAHVEVEGRQQITAPMAGKVVRLLVKAGDKVEAGQGLLVVEAMKMQNEIRSPSPAPSNVCSPKKASPSTPAKSSPGSAENPDVNFAIEKLRGRNYLPIGLAVASGLLPIGNLPADSITCCAR